MKNWLKLGCTAGLLLTLAAAPAGAQQEAATQPAAPALPTVLGGTSLQPPPGPQDGATGQPAAPTGPAALAQGANPGTDAEEYILGPEDIVDLNVVGTADRTRARIYTDGTIQVNLIGQLTAAGKTPRQLAADIQKALKAGGYYSDPVVNVEVSGYASRYVTVLGAVGSPGLVPINRAYKLTDILARVGGVRDTAADYLIVRSESGDERRYDVDKLSSGAIADPTIRAGDKIFSPAAEQFFVNGQVNSPGSYALKTGMTIAQAIAKAGGLTDSGTDKSVKVRRGDKNIKLKPTDKIEPGDILTISERLF